MKLSIPVEETIKKRRSVRTYEDKPLSAEDQEKLMDYAAHLNNPFGVKVNFHIAEKGLSAKGEKLGTYGVIKGASSFLGVSVPKVEFGGEAAGYEFENLILYATYLGLGTVWLAATFSRKSFEAAMQIPKNDLFPAISPVGYPADKKSLTESVMRKTLKADHRKPWNTFFYKNNFSTPLSEAESGDYAVPLAMLRLAPSSSNGQPVRVLKEKNIYHFFETHSAKLSPEEVFTKKVDLGIGLAHFHQTALERNLSGKFVKLSLQGIDIPENMYYSISWICE